MEILSEMNLNVIFTVTYFPVNQPLGSVQANVPINPTKEPKSNYKLTPLNIIFDKSNPIVNEIITIIMSPF